MKQKPNTNTKQGHSASTLLYAVAPKPKLSTDAIALDGAVVSRGNGIGATSEVYLMDCIVGMKDYPDKYFDLAVVDPPYGIGNFVQISGNVRGNAVTWNDSIPTEEYFIELKRVSKEQIIWGANYYNCFQSGGAIIWNKGVPRESNLSVCEIASYSRLKRVDYIDLKWQNINRTEETIHPCQKPVKLYDWIFKNYAKSGYKILDTHLGSGSSRISAHKCGLEFTAFETEEEYFFAQENRFKQYQSQLNLFNK